MSCESCFQSVKGMQQAYAIKRAEAVKWMKDNQRSVAMYQEGYNILFMDAEIAVNLAYNVKEIITYSPDNE